MDRGAAGYNPWGHMESGTTEHTQKHTVGEAWGAAVLRGGKESTRLSN